MGDQSDIIPLLHQLPRPTFFTRDGDFYDPTLCHSGYCLVVLEVSKDQVAAYIRRFLGHPEFGTYAQRHGRVVRLGPVGIAYWQKGAEREHAASWLHARASWRERRRFGRK